jgi:hypothetical protein
MKWFKEVIADIIASVAIVLAAILKINWLEFLVIGYTGFILIARIFLYFGASSIIQKKLSTKVPNVFYHFLYGFNSIFLLANRWWFSGLAWVGIWVLAWLNVRKIKK